MLAKRYFGLAKQTQQIVVVCLKTALKRCRMNWLVILLCLGATIYLHADAPVVDPCDLVKTIAVKANTAQDIRLRVSGTAPLSFKYLGPSHGKLAETPPLLTYTPNTNYAGADSITFTATNTEGTSKAATVNLTVGNMPGPPTGPADSAHTIESDTKKQLVTEWQNVPDVLNVLGAFQLLVRGPRPDRLDCKVLELLKGDNPYGDLKNVCKNSRAGGGPRQGFYRTALGDPGDDGQPQLQPRSNFVATVANANSLGLKTSDDEDRLFACTETLVNAIVNGTSTPLSQLELSRTLGTFDAEIPGPVLLLKIDGAFKASLPVAALYQLLDAYPKPNPTDQIYADALEDLRAAFEKNVQRLEKQIADKITATAP